MAASALLFAFWGIDMKFEDDELIIFLRDFVTESSTFCSFTFSGLYNMPIECFLKAFSHYLKTGDNVLDEYSDITHLEWSSRERSYLYNLDFAKKVFAHKCFWDIDKIFDKNSLLVLEESIKYTIRKDKNNETYKHRREVASAFTVRADIRKKVFKKYGKKCIKCGATKNIQLDHINPVANGGEDSLANLQPLCRACNSSKGCSVEENG